MARTSVIGAHASLIQNDTAYISGRMQPVARLDVDGQNGFTTDYRSLNAETPYVRRNLLCFLLEAPMGFQYLPNGKEMVATLKALVETKAETIDGLDASVKAEYIQVQAGAAEQMDAFSRTTRERSEPSFKWYERYGMAISRFLETWLVMLMGDPISGVPGVVTLRQNTHLTPRNRAMAAYVLMPEMISATMLFVEPDPTLSYPVKSFLCCNMMPDNAGDMTASRDLTSAPDKVEISVKFTAMQEVNQGVNNLAAAILSEVAKTGLSSNERRAYIGDTLSEAMSAYVKNAKSALPGGRSGIGYIDQAREISNFENHKSMKGGISVRGG